MVLLRQNEAIRCIYISDFNIEYIVTNGNANFDLSNAMGGEIKTIPTMFLLTKEGNIIPKICRYCSS